MSRNRRGPKGDATLAWLRGIRDALVFVPILWTWFHLFEAVSAYSDAPTNAYDSFLAGWVDGFQEVPGEATSRMPLVALGVAGCILLVILLTVVISFREHAVGDETAVLAASSGGGGSLGGLSSAEAARLSGALEKLGDLGPALDRSATQLEGVVDVLRTPEGGTASIGGLLVALRDSAAAMQRSSAAVEREIKGREGEITRLRELLDSAYDQQQTMQKVIAKVAASSARSVEAVALEHERLSSMSERALRTLDDVRSSAEQMSEDTILLRRFLADSTLWVGLHDEAGERR